MLTAIISTIGIRDVDQGGAVDKIRVISVDLHERRLNETDRLNVGLRERSEDEIQNI